MTGPAPLPALDRDLTEASNEQLLRVVGLIDTLDRRGPMDRLLDPVRDRLALLRPPRPLALGRVLILPFEDLLVADERGLARPALPVARPSRQSDRAGHGRPAGRPCAACAARSAPAPIR